MLPEIISEVSRYKKVDLGEREIQFLSLIGEGDNSSYKIFARLKRVGKPIDYTNVHKRVKRLHELGLITETKGESIHSAKFYALTSEGLFYLLVGGIFRLEKPWLDRYKDSKVLKYLLEPYFEENTIVIYGVHFEVARYLQECCQMILSSVEALRALSEPKAEEMILVQLQIDLEWQAKALAFKLVSKKTDFWYVVGSFKNALTKTNTSIITPEAVRVLWTNRNHIIHGQHFGPDLVDLTNRYLSLAKDEKFMKLSKNLGKEYEEAFSKLVQTAEAKLAKSSQVKSNQAK